MPPNRSSPRGIDAGRVRILWVACLCLGFAGFAGTAWGASSKPRQPNIVLVLADDLGWTDPGFMGSTVYDTPRLDAFARQGMIFTDAYANAPNCAPSRESIFSGQYTPRHGVYTVRPRAPRGLVPVPSLPKSDAELVTLAEALQSVGYATALFGKWHRRDDPGQHGFDVSAERKDLGYERMTHVRSGGPEGAEDVYLVDELTDLALDFVEKNSDRSFFLYLSHHAVHHPSQAPSAAIERFRKKLSRTSGHSPVYAAMVEQLDSSVGRVLDKLDELKLSQNTIVVFLSDNGGGVSTILNPLRGLKATLYEGGIRVPMVVRWPTVVGAGSRCSVPVMGADLFPTFLEIASVPQPAAQPLDGMSLLPLFGGKTDIGREAIFWHLPDYTPRTGPAAAARSGSWKLIEFFEDGKLELYNLRDDPEESKNLADAMPGKRDELRKKMLDWRKAVSAPIPARRRSEEPNVTP